MAIGPRLDLRQSQTLSMTPQLQQAIKLLQLSNMELNDFLAEEIERNPLLEAQKPGDITDLNRDDPLKSKSETEWHEDNSQLDRARIDEEHRRQQSDAGNGAEAPLASEGDIDTDFENNWTNSSTLDRAEASEDPSVYQSRDQSIEGVSGSGGSMNFDSPDYDFENRLSEESDLVKMLAEQVQLSFASDQDRMLAMLFVDQLDEAGYLRCDLQKMAEELGAPLDRLEDMVKKLQGFEPTGIFARSLSECLGLQLAEQGRLDPMMQDFLDHMDLLERHDFVKLRKTIGCDEEDLADMLGEIRRLDPKPALQFEHFVTQTMVPDVIMKVLPKSSGGGWAVELNSETLPRVLVNKTYYAEVRNVAKDKESKTFLNEHWQSANWLVKALDQRANTILKVSEEIIRKQEAFFLYGIEYLKPLVLRDVADAIGMHESTISRVTTSKFMATPRGVFELKYFFSSAINSADGAINYSSESVKAKIRSLIEQEDPKKVLSDAKLVALLNKDGVDVARRTVVKYREAMGIGSSVERRRQKNPKL